VLLVNGVRTLADVVIVKPTQVYLVSQAVFSHGVAMIVMTQTHEWFLSQLVPSEHVFPYNCEGFRMSTPITKRVSSWISQHGMGIEWH
jgi:hypothetical protein